jgi:hypothetical protein
MANFPLPIAGEGQGKNEKFLATCDPLFDSTIFRRVWILAAFLRQVHLKSRLLI